MPGAISPGIAFYAIPENFRYPGVKKILYESTHKQPLSFYGILFQLLLNINFKLI